MNSPACDAETSESACRICEDDYCLACGWGCDYEAGGDHYEAREALEGR